MSKQPSLITLKLSPARMALSLLETGDYHQALQVFQQVPEGDRTVSDWVNQAVCLLHLNQAEAALTICDQALQLESDYPQAWLFKGVALYQLERFNEAYACYAKASSEFCSTASTVAEPLWVRLWQMVKSAVSPRHS